MSWIIENQQQPTPVSCMHTCLAMAAGVDISEFEDVWELDIAMTHNVFAREAFHLGVYCRPMDGNTIYNGHVYLLSVPSVNMSRMNHAILLDLRDPSDPKLYDPNTGKAGKEVYTLDEYLESRLPFSPIFRLHHMVADPAAFTTAPA